MALEIFPPDEPRPRRRDTRDDVQVAKFGVLRDIPEGVAHAIRAIANKLAKEKSVSDREWLAWGSDTPRSKKPRGYHKGRASTIPVRNKSALEFLGPQRPEDEYLLLNKHITRNNPYTVHNHPSGGTFSQGDLGFMGIRPEPQHWNHFIFQTPLPSTLRDKVPNALTRALLHRPFGWVPDDPSSPFSVKHVPFPLNDIPVERFKYRTQSDADDYRTLQDLITEELKSGTNKRSLLRDMAKDDWFDYYASPAVNFNWE